ncbi:ADAM 17-like protease [Ostrea edulis]|uniref:ADAM 17-like protease n=1 Tax=Ostrea edulis TaxID=37623 RepID=UPI0024AFE489|nr:ADAM 17-like protease [Ostrea edulis]
MTLFLYIALLYCCSSAYGLKDDLTYYEFLKKSDLNRRVRRSVDPRPAAAIHEVWFESFGRKFHLLLKPSVPLSNDFKASAIHKDGSTSEFSVNRDLFFEGTSKTDPESTVHLQWEDDLAIISVNTKEERYFIEPSWRHVSDSSADSMIAYRQSDMKWKPEDSTMGIREPLCNASRGTTLTAAENFEDGLRLFPLYNDAGSPQRRKRQAMSYVGTHTVCRLVVVADYYFYKNLGQKNRRTTGEYIIGIIGRVNAIYKGTVWPDSSSNIRNLGFEIAELVVHDSYTDVPPNGLHYNMRNRPADMGLLLDMFGWEYQKFSTFCLAHLFTYQSFPGKLGLAYIASWRVTDLGGMCSAVAYKDNRKMAANTGLSTYKNPDGSQALVHQATITTAHEFGHNWGSEHDPDTDSCAPSSSSGGRFIMYPSAVSGYEKNNQYFSPCSRQYIYKVVMRKGYDCFEEASSSGQGLCGNGRVDRNEECDAGYTGDKCCNEKCQFRVKVPGQIQCSPMNFACCVNCTVAPRGYRCLDNVDDNFDCKGTSHCDGSRLTCPNATFKLDGTPCHNGYGKCKNGRCLDACRQIGRNPCLCTGDDACKKCCYKPNTELCEPLSEQTVEDGRPCYNGFCKKGKCEKSESKLVQRLYSIIQSLSIDRIAEFMKNNIVWIVFYLTIPLWIAGSVLVNKLDKKTEQEDEKSRGSKRDEELRMKVLLAENENIRRTSRRLNSNNVHSA